MYFFFNKLFYYSPSNCNKLISSYYMHFQILAMNFFNSEPNSYLEEVFAVIFSTIFVYLFVQEAAKDLKGQRKSNARVITNSKNLVTSLAELRLFSDFITFVSRKKVRSDRKKIAWYSGQRGSNARVIINSKNLDTSLDELSLFSDLTTFVSRKKAQSQRKKLHDILGNSQKKRYHRKRNHYIFTFISFNNIREKNKRFELSD